VVEPLPVVSIVYSIQIGAYSDVGNCLSKIDELKSNGVANGFYQQDSNLCKVYSGIFVNRTLATIELQKLRATVFSQSFVVPISVPSITKIPLKNINNAKAADLPYSIQLGAFTSNGICDDKFQQVTNLNLPNVRKQPVNGLCKVFSGNYSSKQQAESALSTFPPSIIKGAFIVRL
jgi:cell division septation protein DedD